MSDVRSIIYEHVKLRATYNCEWENAFRSLFSFISTDDAVKWFVEEYCGSDEDYLIAVLGDEEGSAVLLWYESHCQ